jgi:hypothetical protein
MWTPSASSLDSSMRADQAFGTIRLRFIAD